MVDPAGARERISDDCFLIAVLSGDFELAIARGAEVDEDVAFADAVED